MQASTAAVAAGSTTATPVSPGLLELCSSNRQVPFCMSRLAPARDLRLQWVGRKTSSLRSCAIAASMQAAFAL